MHRPFRLATLSALACALFMVAGSPQASAEGEYEATTTRDPQVALDRLDLMLLPLTKAQLEVEASSWMGLLQEKVQQISDAELAVKQRNEEIQKAAEAAKTASEQAGVGGGEARPEDLDHTAEEAQRAAEAKSQEKATALETLNTLRDERAALIDRTNAVLTALEKKGGDASEQRLYIAAVSGIRIDVTDTSAAWATVAGWLSSKEGGMRWGANIGKFLAIIVVFWLLAALLGKATDKAVKTNRRMSHLMRNFVSKSVRRLVFVIGIIVAITALEINTTPLLAAIGAAGIVVGLALQDTLGNFASGIMILMYRPFDVGDVIDVSGVSGKVSSLNLVSTTIKTFDNKVLILPNNAVWGNTITNVTGSKERRVDMVFGISYESDIAKAQEILERLVRDHELTLDDPEPVIKLHELADSSVNFICRPWVKTADYWTVFWDVTRAVKEEFDRAGISIPYPQRDIHVHHAAKEPPVTEISAGAGERVVS